jgi:dTDP-4-amino-4,6-dideoxygalactose transaminase
MDSEKKIPFINLKSQYELLKANIDSSIQKVLDHGVYINGPEVQEFEGMLSEFTLAKHAITCANGTDALSISLMALNLGANDVIFVPSFTYIASVEAISVIGAIPFFVDVKDDFNICPISLENAINDSILLGLKPAAVIPVDLFGKPSRSNELDKILKHWDLKVVYDAAQSFGAEYEGVKTGNCGDITTTSFFPAKPLGCYGDGGAIFTNNDDLAKKIRSIKNHGMGKHKYEHVNVGVNSRLDTIQAAILIEKLKFFPEELRKRNKIAEYYSNNIQINNNSDLILPHTSEAECYSWAQYTLMSKNRDVIMEKLKAYGIPTVIYYPLPLNKQEAYDACHIVSSGVPNSEDFCGRVFSLPMSPYLDKEHQDYIINCLNTIVREL